MSSMSSQLPGGSLSLGSLSLGLGTATISGISSSVGTIILATSDKCEVHVDRQQLCECSKFFQDMLSSCDTGRVQLDETKESMELLLDVMKGVAPVGTFDTRSKDCWEVYKKILTVADKYDCPVVRERCEKWLVSRCLRGKVCGWGWGGHLGG